jgi:hypothetical protein
MSSEHFGQLAWQFKRMSGSSGLRVQAAIPSRVIQVQSIILKLIFRPNAFARSSRALAISSGDVRSNSDAPLSFAIFVSLQALS